MQAYEIWPGLESGDLVFIETADPLARFLKRATGSRLTHVGLMRDTGGGPYILDATPQDGVFEVAIDEFIERGVGHRYAVYRFNGLKHPGTTNHPAIKTAFDHHYLKPYDPYFRLEKSAFYDAELIWTTYAEAGARIGKFQRLRDLGGDTSEGRAVFLSDWRHNPLCKSATRGIEACWAQILDQEIITPASIANDPRMTRVYSSFDDAR
ncbi:YiiX/YebB-like N1pC/P60 family cysteine hydrolase [Breoghania sp.]|uniref:YiiX/YebB-like N1pC/P60 family cysteine hydrolase n=2 Tax=Breoghania sp. TaxID=2065378 RepID=UPI002AAB16A8|nr:YiiX/YebB-like N1pC/P60 family cysteine hydrolase [Breoghania sp.]